MRPNKAARIAANALENDKYLAQQIGSVALALEAVETLLVAEGIVEEGDVMKQMKALIELKKQQMEASNEHSRGHNASR